MNVRSQLRWSVDRERTRRSAQQVCALLAFVFTQAAFAGYVLAGWRLLADLDLLGQFFVSSGLLSRWQVWVALGVLMQMTGSMLQRLANEGNTSLP